VRAARRPTRDRQPADAARARARAPPHANPPFPASWSRGRALRSRYVQEEHRAKFDGAELDLSGWTDVSWSPAEIPQQNNGFDCGVFMCQFASAFVRNVAINFDSSDMPYMRCARARRRANARARAARERPPDPACASLPARVTGVA
jgi:hypothetical protein